MATPTIGIDLSFLSAARTGVGAYALGLFQPLARTAPDGFDLLAWTGAGFEPLARHLSRAEVEPGESGAASWRMRALLRRVGPLHRAARLLRDRAARPCDLFHAINFLPSQAVQGAVVPTIHDLAWRRHPDCLPAGWVARLDAGAETIRQAPAVHTVSEFSRGEIVARLGVEEARIHVIPPAVEPGLFSLRAAGHAPPFGLRRDGFILSVGTLEPRKNLATLIDAFLALTPAERRACPLVIAGPSGWGEMALSAGAEAAVARDEIRFLGYVPRARLHGLLASARALAYPSLYEGFGMPVLEATAAGTPALVSRAAALVESGCGLARTVETRDVEAWAQALSETIAREVSPGEREALALAAGRFSWEASAARTLDLYRAALAAL